MQRVMTELKRRQVPLHSLNALEVFGGAGNFHTMDYDCRVSSLEVWEVEVKYEHLLRRNLPFAEIKITDSYKELTHTLRKYDLVVVDNPMSTWDGYCEHFELFPAIFRVLEHPAILVLDVIPEVTSRALKKFPYLFNDAQLARRKSFYKTSHPEKLSFDELATAYENLIMENGFNLEWYFFQRRDRRSFVYYLVLKIHRAGAEVRKDDEQICQS
jgi:hypothetical protein